MNQWTSTDRPQWPPGLPQEQLDDPFPQSAPQRPRRQLTGDVPAMPQLEFMLPPTTSDSPSGKRITPLQDDWSEGWRTRLVADRASQKGEGKPAKPGCGRRTMMKVGNIGDLVKVKEELL